jgi:hypothetical protein
MTERATWILRNASRRPVELHLPGGVVVLPAWGGIELEDPGPVCLALEKRGVLTRHAVPAPASTAAPAPVEATPPQSTTSGGARTRGSARKTTGFRTAKGDSA